MKTESPQESPGKSASPGSGPDADAPASRAFADAAARLAEVREYISFYIATRTDAIRLAARKTIFYAVLGILALLCAAAMVITAVVLLLSGLARGLGSAMGGRAWAGELIVGFGVLAIMAMAAWIGASAITAASRRRTVEKYESRKRQQHARFGRDVGTAPAAPERSGTPKGKSSSSEAEYLDRQAAAAKAAISGAFADLKTDLARGADPRVWMKSHPWITLASAAAAGFAAATTLVPSKEQQALNRLAAIQEALHDSGRSKSVPSNGHGSDAAAGDKRRGLLGMILHELLAILKPAFISLISAQFAPTQTPDSSNPTSANPDLRDVS